MSDTPPQPVPDQAGAVPVKATALPERPKLDPVAVFFALGSEVRLPIIRLLADGKGLSTSAIAAELGRDFDGVGKQLSVLRNAGLVTTTTGQDRRQTIHQIPASLRPGPGMLEVGFCRIELTQL